MSLYLALNLQQFMTLMCFYFSQEESETLAVQNAVWEQHRISLFSITLVKTVKSGDFF